MTRIAMHSTSTPLAATVIMFARNRIPQGDCVRAVLGINGEPNTPADPSKGVVWQSLLRHIDLVDARDNFSSSADVPRSTFSSHPWSIGGGGAAELKERIEAACTCTLGDISDSIGYATILGDDEAFVLDSEKAWQRQGITQGTKGFAVGDRIRDWTATSLPVALYPYDDAGAFRPIEGAERHFWTLRRLLRSGLFYRQTKEERGLNWRQYAVIVKDKLFRPEALLFAFVATPSGVLVRQRALRSQRSS